MSLKLPDKGQWAFIGLVMCLVTYYTGSVAVYFLNGKTPLYIWKNFDSMLLWRIITESNIRTDIRLTAIPLFYQVWFRLSLCLFYYLATE